MTFKNAVFSLSVVVCLLLAFNANAQQRPQFTQYSTNNFVLNPAIAGIENYMDVRIAQRNQWINISGAPVTSYVSAHMALGTDYLRSNPNTSPGIGENPFSRSYLQNYMAEPAHHGVGLIAVVDKIGPINRTDLSVVYSYHIGLTRHVNMSVGLAPGVSIIKLDQSKITTGSDGDAAIAANALNQTLPDLSAGVWIYGAQFFVGVSSQQIIPQKLAFTNKTDLVTGKTVPHFFYTAGFKFSFINDIAFQPSVMFKQVSDVPNSIDFNLKTTFRDYLWIGTTYRTTDSFAFMVGINPTYYLNISYSYDMIQSALSVATSGSHEIVIGFLLNNRYKARCPKKMW